MGLGQVHRKQSKRVSSGVLSFFRVARRGIVPRGTIPDHQNADHVKMEQSEPSLMVVRENATAGPSTSFGAQPPQRQKHVAGDPGHAPNYAQDDSSSIFASADEAKRML
jgi:hypothetical protein